MDVIKEILAKKFAEIELRIMLALEQLNDEQVNWRPNEASNSIANLVVHISGNIHERIGKGIHNKNYTRDRDQEFEATYQTALALKNLISENFSELIETTISSNEGILYRTQMVRDQERSNLDVLFQCSTHFSEHMGQILYIAKILLDQNYMTTSVPKKRKIEKGNT